MENNQEFPDRYSVLSGIFSTSVLFVSGLLMLVYPVVYVPVFPMQRFEVPYPELVAVCLFSLSILFAITTFSLEKDRRDLKSARE